MALGRLSRPCRDAFPLTCYPGISVVPPCIPGYSLMTLRVVEPSFNKPCSLKLTRMPAGSRIVFGLRMTPRITASGWPSVTTRTSVSQCPQARFPGDRRAESRCSQNFQRADSARQRGDGRAAGAGPDFQRAEGLGVQERAVAAVRVAAKVEPK